MSYLLVQANALRIPLADKSVHMCVTSPPYWGLRDYGVAGQLGLEPTPDKFIRTMTAVFREVWRVLRDDGTLWVNMGDSYAAGKMGRDDSGDNGRFGGPRIAPVNRSAPDGLTPKDLCGVPWRLAFALQADGWYLRSDIIWAKPNPMPESVTDRPTKSHEYVFLFSKQERYYFDQEAIREPHQDSEREANRPSRRDNMAKAVGNGYTTYHIAEHQASMDQPMAGHPNGRNIRTVWSIPTESYAGAHFATFPRRLVEPCIKAGTSEKGCCPVCGAGWVRIVESERVPTRTGTVSKAANGTRFVVGNRDPRRHVAAKKDLSWCPTCSHNAAPVPAVVLDPFSGSGTTGVVANALGRSYIGLDLNREYIGLAQRRIDRPHAPIPRPGKPEHLPLFGDAG